METVTVDVNDITQALTNQRDLFANESAKLAAQLYGAHRRIAALEAELAKLKPAEPAEAA